MNYRKDAFRTELEGGAGVNYVEPFGGDFYAEKCTPCGLGRWWDRCESGFGSEV